MTTATIDRKTAGADRKHLGQLARRVRAAIDTAYASANGHGDESRGLRDYAENIGTTDKFERLIDTEAKAEREHRGWGPDWQRYHARVSVKHAALVMALHNLGDGAARDAAPTVADFLTLRPGAVEALAVGYLARTALRADAGLVEALQALDYAAVVSVKGGE